LGVTIRKTEFGFKWQPDNARDYSITETQVFPTRMREQLLDLFKTGETQTVYFRYYIYDRVNKILFLSQTNIK
jgi:hypothetical protein